MKKISIFYKVIIGLLLIVIVSTGILYLKFASLKVYDWNDNTVTRAGVVYEQNTELFKKYLNGEIKSERIIGKSRGDKFLGFKTWILKLKGYDENDVILVRGLMFEEIYANRQKYK